MPAQPATRVVTGAADDGRRRVLHLAVGLLGWLLWAGLIIWLALHASAAALDVATFLATVIVTVALLSVVTALALRPAVMRRRALAPAIEAAAAAPPAVGAALDGEIAVQGAGGERRYVSALEPDA
jgi:hypothetical protein